MQKKTHLPSAMEKAQRCFELYEQALYEQAVAEATSVLKADGTNCLALLARALSRRMLEGTCMTAEVKADLKQATAGALAAPLELWAWVVLSCEALLRESFTSCVRNVMHAIDTFHPTGLFHRLLRLFMANALFYGGTLKQTITCASIVLENCPDSALALWILVCCLLKIEYGENMDERRARAEKYILRVIELTPAYYPVYVQYASVLRNRGDSRADEMLQKAIAMNPKFPNPYIMLATEANLRGDVAEADQIISRIPAVDVWPYCLALRADYRWKQGLWASAGRDITRAMRLLVEEPPEIASIVWFIRSRYILIAQAFGQN